MADLTRARRALLLAPLLMAMGCAPPARRPSVLLITIDTLRADHLGCYGYVRPTSPRIDRLAAEGVLFERAYTTLPRTTQSIASLMTGRFPRNHGARGLFSFLPAANQTLAEILGGEGYATAAIVSNMFLRPGRGFEQGFGRYDNPPRRWDGNSAGEVTAEALQWLDGLPPGKPFFLWVHYLDPHWTYLPGAPFDGAFTTEPVRDLTVYDDLRAGRLTKGQVIFENRLNPRQIDHVRALYDGEIARTDAALSPLLDRATARTESPVLVMLTSDHGESLGENGYFFAHGEYLYEPGLRIPLIVRLPGAVPSGLRIGALVQIVDVAPTILGLLGIGRMQSVDGRPLLLPGDGREDGPAAFRPAPGRGLVFAESDFQLIHPENRRYYVPGPAGKWSSITDGRYKLIHIPRTGEAILELYDLAADPGEMRDLEKETGLAGESREAHERLLRELRRTVDYAAGAGAADPAGPAIDPDQARRLRSLGYIN
jgi:arylsulfatase